MRVINGGGSSGGSAVTGGGIAGGLMSYSNAAGDFVATVTASGNKQITVTGLPFTLEDKHVIAGFGNIQKSTGQVIPLDFSNIAVAASSVITLSANSASLASSDTVMITVIGPDKTHDKDNDAQNVIVLNPENEKYI